METGEQGPYRKAPQNAFRCGPQRSGLPRFPECLNSPLHISSLANTGKHFFKKLKTEQAKQTHLAGGSGPRLPVGSL